MRKLLILMLVLGMAPLAGATISFVSNAATVGISGTAVVEVSSDADSSTWVGYVGLTSTIGSLTAFSAETIAGSEASVSAGPAGYTGYYRLFANDTTVPYDSIVAGVQFTGSVKGLLEGTYTFDLTGSDWATVADTYTLTVIPEPITMALLGLGGLFLRRRK